MTPVRRSRALYKALLRAYPAAYRAKYAKPMAQVFGDLCQDAWEHAGPWGLAELWSATAPELVRTAVTQHILAALKGGTMAIRPTVTEDWWKFTLWFWGWSAAATLLLAHTEGSDSPITITLVFASGGIALISLMYWAYRASRKASVALTAIAGCLLTFWALAYVGGDHTVVGTLLQRVFPGIDTSLIDVSEPLLILALSLAAGYAYLAVARKVDYNLNGTWVGRRLQGRFGRVIIPTAKRTVLGLLILFILANLVSLYDPAQSDADLLLPSRHVPDSQNMFFTLERMHLSTEKGRDFDADYHEISALQALAKQDPPDEQKVNDELARHADMLALLHAAAALPYYQSPGSADSSTLNASTTIPDMSGYRAAAYLAYLNARKQQEAGQTMAATGQLLDALKVALAIQQSHGSLIEYMVGLSMQAIGAQGMQDTLATGTLDPGDLRALISQVDSLIPPPSGIQEAFRMEHTVGVHELAMLPRFSWDGMSQYGLSSTVSVLPLYYQPNRTQKIRNEQERQAITQATLPCGELPPVGNPPSSTYMGDPFGISPASVFTPNALGKQLANLSITNYTTTFERRCNVEFVLRAIQVQAATRLYVQDHSSYPSSLAQLVPTYLQAVPADPYDRQEIRYDPSGHTIWTSGRTGAGNSDDVNLPLKLTVAL